MTIDESISGTVKLRRFQKFAALDLLLVIASIGMRLASDSSASASFLVLSVYALLGRAQAIQALALSWLFTMLNPGIAPATEGAWLGRFIVIGAAAASVLFRSGFFRREMKVTPIVAGTLLLGVFLVIHSLFVSSLPSVSVLKAVSWSIVMATLLAAWAGLERDERHRTAESLFLGLIAVLLISLPLLFHSLGYLRNDRGFQGILSHPQAFGPVVALLGAWVTSRLIAESRPRLGFVLLSIVCPVLIFLSQARTAGASLVLGVAVAVILVPILGGRRILKTAPGLKSRRFALVAAAAFTGLVVMAPALNEQVQDFIAKGTPARTLTEAYSSARGRLMEEMLINIRSNPISGIGFGIASDPWAMEITRDPVFAVPIGAPVEKGVMPLAVVEEVGIPGATLISIWLFVLLRRSARVSITSLAVVSTGLLLNLGESTLFSPGGIGLIFLILLAWAATYKPKSDTSSST